CAAQDACAQAYPDLAARFFAAVEPVTAALVPMGSESGVASAPRYMDAIARQDPEVLERLDAAPSAMNLAWGMRFSVWCSEALPFSRRVTSAGPGPALGGYESAAIKPAHCAAWDVPTVNETAVQPVVSEVPALIVAGEFDPLTPPRWGELAARTLANSLVVSVRGASHSPTQYWSGDGCAMDLADLFIQDPRGLLAAPPAEHCVFTRSAPEYQTGQE
ncbi:MAG: alpha/beta hydrolase, partial [Pseudomonadota bacterium]